VLGPITAGKIKNGIQNAVEPVMFENTKSDGGERIAIGVLGFVLAAIRGAVSNENRERVSECYLTLRISILPQKHL
jgi:hypothetical protein